MPHEGANAAEHLDSGVIGNNAHDNYGNSALDYVQGAAGQPCPRPYLAVHVGCAAVVVADTANVAPQREAGEEVGGGDCAYEVGQQSQPEPAGYFDQRFHECLRWPPL